MEIKDRILVVLFKCGAIEDTGTFTPFERTQKGLIKSMELHQSQISKYARELMAELKIMRFRAYPTGTDYTRKQAAYYLTDKGRKLALSLWKQGGAANDILPSPHKCGGFPTQPAQLKTIPLQRGDRY